MPGGPRWLSNQASSGCFSADNRSLSMEKRSPTINASGNKVRLKKVDGCKVSFQVGRLRAGNVASLPGELGAQAASQGSVRFVPAGFEEQPDRKLEEEGKRRLCVKLPLEPNLFLSCSIFVGFAQCLELISRCFQEKRLLFPEVTLTSTTSEVSEPQACTRPAVLPVLHGSLAQSLLRCQLDRRCPRVRPSRWRPVPASRRCLVHGGMPDTRACSSCSDPAKDLDSDARTEPVGEVQEEGLEIRCHGLALPVSILAVPRAVSCSMKTFQALPDAHSSPKRPPKWTLQGQERQECGVCSEAPGSLGPRVRSRMDPVGARILTLSRLPGSPAISRAVGCLPKRRSSRKTRTHLLLWAVLGSPGPEGQEGASGRVSSSGSKA
ncbi:hypothetical protein MJT46_017382 [Ovis ammon polii x Ovis aries]|nr:hypothetical protein MJT46_017382 [Ovis ammon polii x Ovis aries]